MVRVLTVPVVANAIIRDFAEKGTTLPAGELRFVPPLDLTDMVGLFGAPSGTTLRAVGGKPGPLVTITTTLPGDVAIGLPKRRVVRDLRIVGNGPDAGEHGLFLDCGCVRFERVEVLNCLHGVVVKWAVDVAFRDAIFSRNACNVYVPGSGLNTVTTLRFSGCNIREAMATGVLIQEGLGITFDDRTIIESNGEVGLRLQTLQNTRIKDVICRDVWFENNPRHLDDPQGIARLESCWVETP
jgi:hypothetical protein